MKSSSTSNFNKQVTIMEIHRVTPNSTTPTESPTEITSLPLTFFDTFWFKFHPVKRVFFYELIQATSSYFNLVIVPTLKDSLSQTLSIFSPLAGSLTWPENAPAPSVLYRGPDDGVWLTVGESNDPETFTRVSGFSPVAAAWSRACVPELEATDSEAAVVFLQVTLFAGHGFSIGVSNHHAVLDGKSATMFVKAWTHINKLLLNNISNPSIPPELTPCFDRGLVNDPDELRSDYLRSWSEITKSLPGLENPRSLKLLPATTFRSDPDNLVRATYEISQQNIQKLREKIRSLDGSRRVHHLSTFVIAHSYTLVSFAKSMEERPGSLLIGFTAERARIDPQLPETYFGNCVSSYWLTVGYEELRGEDGVLVAAEGLSKLKSGLERGEALRGAKGKLGKLVEAWFKDGVEGIGVAGSPRFGVYGSDFGWGRPTKVEVTSIDATGAFSMAESKDGNGGVEVGLVLDKHQMEVFGSLFAGGFD